MKSLRKLSILILQFTKIMKTYFTKYTRLLLFFFITLITFPSSAISQKANISKKQLRLGVIGLVHDHVSWILNRKKEDVSIVGIVETNKTAIVKYQKLYKLHDSLFFKTYEALYSKVNPDAVSAFNETKEHLEVVKFFAPRGIPIMLEKPMATSYNEALEMARLSKKHEVPLLINYETSWYESTYEAKKIMTQNMVGNLTKMVFNTRPLKVLPRWHLFLL